MDYAIVTNLLLFLGAMGATFALDGGSSDDDDDEGDSESTAGATQAHMAAAVDAAAEGDDSLAADRDNLAWFLEAEEDQAGVGGIIEGKAEPAEEPANETAVSEAEPETTAQDAGQTAFPEASEDAGEEDTDDADIVDMPEDTADAPAAAGQVELVYAPALDPATDAALVPVVTVEPTEDGAGSVVLLDGEVVATFDDLPNLAPGDVHLVADDSAGDALTEDGYLVPSGESLTEVALPDPQEDPDAVVLIEDYLAGADRIEIGYQPATDADGTPLAPEITVAQDAEHLWATVLLDGQAVARVMGSGAASLRASDILPVALQGSDFN